MKDFREQIPSFGLTRMEGGSGFPCARLLRHFFLEYLTRFGEYGPHSFPTSFNVVESFLLFSERFMAFDIREEREHLLRLDDYLDWYTAGSFPNDPAVLREILEEGVIHAYNMVSPLDDFGIETESSKISVLGVQLVRHGAELSAVMVAGERPPFIPDVDADREAQEGRPAVGKEGLRPDPTLTVADRYLPELPNHVSVILLARFDLERSRYDVRYINVDMGPGYAVFTDDSSVFRGESDDLKKACMARMDKGIVRYSSMFSALLTMIYLPAFYIDQVSRVVETKFATSLRIKSTSTAVRRAIEVLSRSQVPFFRAVRCVAGRSGDSALPATRTVEPPEMGFRTSGYWKPIAAGEIGQAQDGTPIVGKTWVERTESWTARSPQSFVVSKQPRPSGPDPGCIYVMRSDSHVVDLYKVGLTRRQTEERARELSTATGVPTTLAVLAQWEVGDCGAVEAETHKRLASLRVNKRREFFRGSLQVIVSVIGDVVRGVSS